jgi:hypothetical protein
MVFCPPLFPPSFLVKTTKDWATTKHDDQERREK